jgi:amino acid permease
MSEESVAESAPSVEEETPGSSVGGVVFNFTNSIIGAGAIGLGGAIAISGGFVSVFCILFFATLTKISLDMVIDMGSSYEELGRKCYGVAGWSAVLLSKMMYAFGCLVAYIVVVKDNFGSALGHLIGIDFDEIVVTLVLSTTVMLPLCLLRDMTPLSNLSLVSVASMGMIVIIVLCLYFVNPDDIRQEGGTFYENWLEIRPGLWESLGTFVFSFVSQHTVHLSFESLKPELQTIQVWKRISTYAIGLSTVVSLSVGVFVYMTFWNQAGSDLFDQYPALPIIDVAKLLLCITMLLTFPFPFFTCRDMMIVAAIAITKPRRRVVAIDDESSPVENDLEEPLLPEEPDPQQDTEEAGEDEEDDETADEEAQEEPLPSWLVANRQLKLPQHIIVTVTLWVITTTLAIVAPNLGDVLNLVGCATGTVIAFILPALFSFQLNGYSHTALFLLVVGGLVGLVGTVFSTKQLIVDADR